MASQADIRRVELEIERNATISTDADLSMSWWDRALEYVTPQSYGESLVNEIYSAPARTLRPDPIYNRNDLSSPNVYVQTKGAIQSGIGALSDAASALGGFGKKALIIGALFIVLLVVVYVAVPAFIRR